MVLRLVLVFYVIAPSLLAGATGHQVSCAEIRIATSSRIHTAMAETSQGGFALEAPANGVPLLAKILYRLAREQDPGQLLYVPQDSYFDAFVELTGIDPGSVPAHLRVPFEFGQDYLIRVDDTARRDPELRLTVVGVWPHVPGSHDVFNYTALIPGGRLEVVQDRITSYDIHYFEAGNLVLLSNVTGVSGRVAGGPLGILFEALFGLLGDAEVLEATMVFTPSQHTAAEVFAQLGPFKASTTITVSPEGVAGLGLAIPRGERELVQDRLERTLSPFESRELEALAACLEGLQNER